MTDLERQVRFLKRYSLGSSVFFLVLIGAVFIQGPKRFRVLEVERLNVVTPDGKLALALAGRGGLPGPMLDGKSFPPELSGGRTTSAGMIFFNESGDEVGGMTWSGSKTAEGYRAGGHLSFDQWKQDEVITLDYSDNGTSRRSGLRFTDRPTDFPLTEAIPMIQAIRSATGTTKDSLEREMQALAAQGKLGAQRIFIGSENRTAVLRMRDKLGKERIRLFVDTANVARLEFLDDQGAVVARFPQ
jgi:hypothetical protein